MLTSVWALSASISHGDPFLTKYLPLELAATKGDDDAAPPLSARESKAALAGAAMAKAAPPKSKLLRNPPRVLKRRRCHPKLANPDLSVQVAVVEAGGIAVPAVAQWHPS